MVGPSHRRLDASKRTPSFNWATSTYEHNPLPTSTSIRILQLQPGERPKVIKCSLSVVDRDHAPPYEALSYAWGKGTETRVINCEDRKLKVTVNLRNALWSIRDSIKVKYLWADAACINQKDDDERAAQVRQMPQIYANAVRVLVWLDFPNGKVPNFDDLFNFNFNLSTYLPGDRSGRASQLLHDHIAKLESPDVNADSLDIETELIASALSQLFDSPWFFRLWVVQEVGMAKSVLALIGDESLDFVDLMRFCIRLERRTIFMDQLGIFTAGRATAFATFPARSKELLGELEDEYDFLEMMEVTRAHRASDPRDYVYALLGHPSAQLNDRPIAEPNYGRSAESLFFELSTKIIAQTNTLRLLSAVHHSDSSSLVSKHPSWIPTWSRPVTTALSLNVYREHNFHVQYNAAADAPIWWNTLDSKKALQVRGFIFDRVKELEDQSGHFRPKSLDELVLTALQFQNRVSTSSVDDLEIIGETLSAGFSNQNSKRFRADFAALRLHLIDATASTNSSAARQLAPEGLEQLRGDAKNGTVDGIYWASSRFCIGRKLFSTQSGKLGLGPAAVRENDLCCILFGAKVPFVLRPVGNQCKLVGETYIHGVMQGEAMTEWKDLGRRKPDIFELI